MAAGGGNQVQRGHRGGKLRRRRDHLCRAKAATTVAVGAVVGLVAMFLPAISAGAAGVTAPVPSSPAKVPIGRAIPAPARARDLGAEDTTVPLHLDVSLAPRDPAALQSFVSELYDPSSPMYHHFLAKGQFGPTFGASAATIQSVESQLEAAGLRPGPVNPDDMIIPVTTTVGQADKALGVTLHSYRLASGRIAFANTTPPLLPPTISSSVVAIVGLSTLYQPRPQDLAPTASPARRAVSASAGLAAQVSPRTVGPVGCTNAQTAGATPETSWRRRTVSRPGPTRTACSARARRSPSTNWNPTQPRTCPPSNPATASQRR
jgi:hypothetical protein